MIFCKVSLYFDFDSVHVEYPWIVMISINYPFLHVATQKYSSVRIDKSVALARVSHWQALCHYSTLHGVPSVEVPINFIYRVSKLITKNRHKQVYKQLKLELKQK